MIVDQTVTLRIAPREDGGVRIYSDDLPGLILSGPDREKVFGDLGAAIYWLLEYKRNAAAAGAADRGGWVGGGGERKVFAGNETAGRNRHD